jgi:transposase
MDIGDRYIHLHVIETDGEVSEEARIAATKRAVSTYFKRTPRSRVALEVGTHSQWVDKLVGSFGHEVLVVNPRKLRLISENDKKTDRADARILAELARAHSGLLHTIQHRGEEAVAALALVRSRDCLVSTRTKLINHVRGSVKPTGERLPACSSDNFGTQLDELPESRREALAPLMAQIESMTKTIHAYDAMIAELLRTKFPEAERLQQVPGVGPLTALTFLATIEDPNRFPRCRAVGSYVGLRPRLDQSGQTDKQLRITKAGDGLLRRLLVCSSHYVLGPFGPDSDLRRWGEQLAARGGKNAKKRACVAVARKLAVLLLTLWKTGSDYEPLRQANREVVDEPQTQSAPTPTPATVSLPPPRSSRRKSPSATMNP